LIRSAVINVKDFDTLPMANACRPNPNALPLLADPPHEASPLPPGIAKKLASAPMFARLPAYSGHEGRVVGSDLVLSVAIATAVVV
jgi:hypothetical protein